MFNRKKNDKKNTLLSFELVKPDSWKINVHIANDDAPDKISVLIGMLLTNHPDIVAELVNAINQYGKDNGWSDKGNKVVDNIVKIEKKIKETTSKEEISKSRKRNPLIRPTATLGVHNMRLNQ